jgi:hypothetical protein
MSAAVDLVISKEWETSIPDVLQAAGFHVTTGSRRLPGGSLGISYSCVRDGKTISLTEIPLPDDPSYVAILGLSGPKHSETLLYARDALQQRGAIDVNEYEQRTRS